MAKRLKAPTGADEANFGAEKYRVDNDGTVTVPDEAAGPLIRTGGFVDITPDVADPAPEGFIKITRAEPGPCSHDGVVYEPDENGHLTVPHAAVDALSSFGYVPVGMVVEAPEPEADTPPEASHADDAPAADAEPVAEPAPPEA